VIEARCTVTDTLAMAREKFPGQRNSLDALCDRFSVDKSQRILHGALLDAELLAEVYLAPPPPTGPPNSRSPPPDAARIATPLIPRDRGRVGSA